MTLSGELSSTIQSAELAARDAHVHIGDVHDDVDRLDVRIVDSRTVSLGLGTIVLACAEAAATGADADAVEALARRLVDRTRVFGALETVENLRRGGRIGNARAMLATALAIKPIIEVADGVVEQHGRQRTRSKALAFLVGGTIGVAFQEREHG